MRNFAVLYMCLLLSIVQSTPIQTTNSTTVHPGNASSSHNDITTDSNITTTSPTHITSPSPTHITSPSPNLQSQSSWIPSPRPTITQPLFTRPVVTTSTMAKPLLTTNPSPGTSNQPHGSASAQYVHFGFLLISLMFLVVVEL